MTARRLLLLVSIFLSACARVPPDAGFPAVEELVEGRVEQRLAWRRGGPDDEAVAAAVDALLRSELTLEAAVQIALLENPSLQAVYEELGIAQAELVQAGLLRNPIFSGSVRFPDRAGSSANLELAVVQGFLDAVMRPARRRLAETEFERTRLRVAAEVLVLSGRVEAAYWEAVAAAQTAELRSLIAAAAEASLEMAIRLRDAGNASELDVARERDLAESARLEVGRAAGELTAARERLTRLLGLWGERIGWRAPSRLPELPAEEVPLERLEATAIAERLDLAAARKEVELRAEALGITEKWKGLAVADAGLSAERESEDGWVVGPEVAVELPVFDQGKARVARLVSELRRSEHEMAALAVDIRSEVRELRARLELMRERALRYRDVVIPLRERIVELTQLKYNYMLAGVFELLAAKGAEYDAYEEYIESVRDYWVARAELKRALGGRWPGPEGFEEGR